MAAISLALVLWEVTLGMFSTYDQSSGFRSGPSERRVQSRSTPEVKPESLWTCGPAPSPAATPRVCHRPPDCTRGSPHSSAHPGTLWCWLSSWLLKMWGGMMWPSLETSPKTITLAGNFVFITLGMLNRPGLHFEGADNGPVNINWIGREHEFYCGASPISLVEHCVTFRHDRRLLLLLGFVNNWPNIRWCSTKKENWFSLKRKWNHVVFSRTTNFIVPPCKNHNSFYHFVWGNFDNIKFSIFQEKIYSSLLLSCHTISTDISDPLLSIASGRSSGLHPVSAQSCCV